MKAKTIAYTTWTFGFWAYLFVSVCYQHFWGTEPFNNAFSVGLPRFYFEFYASDCQKLNGESVANFSWNLSIYSVLWIAFTRISKVLNR